MRRLRVSSFVLRGHFSVCAGLNCSMYTDLIPSSLSLNISSLNVAFAHVAAVELDDDGVIEENEEYIEQLENIKEEGKFSLIRFTQWLEQCCCISTNETAILFIYQQ